MSKRRAARQLVIKAATALGLDGLSRAHVTRDATCRRAAVVRVLYFHGTPAATADRFRQQLAWLREHFLVIDFAAFTKLFDGSGTPAGGRPAALLTFDDGFASNYHVAAPLLEESGLRGVFFVVPAFSVTSGLEAQQFHERRIRGRSTTPFEAPMTPTQIRELAGRGHTIGNHTFSHARLSDTRQDEYDREILQSAALIESWTDRPVEAFAWPFAWNAITPAAHRAARQRHAFCFAPCAGMVDVHADSRDLVWRTNAEADRSFDEFRFQCSGLADLVAAGRRRQLRRLLATNPELACEAA